MRIVIYFSLVLGIIFALAACQTAQNPPAKTVAEYGDQRFDAMVDLSPEGQTYLGIKKDYGKLDDQSKEMAERFHHENLKTLEGLKQFNKDQLDPVERLNYDLLLANTEESIQEYKYRYHSYSVNQMFGRHSTLPSFMINMHQVTNEADAEAYISRINAIKKNFEQLVDHLKASAQRGVVPPKFVFPKVKDDIQNLLSGRPFEVSKKDSPLLEDFKKKVAALKLDTKKEKDLVEKLKQALQSSFAPGYKHLLSFWNQLEKQADDRHGVWKFKDGDEYYQHRLKSYTTTDMMPEEVHNLGLQEVERIHNEMRVIQRKVGFKGSLKSFFNDIRENKKLYLSNSKKGRQAYLTRVSTVVDRMRSQLPLYFGRLPKANLVVRPVEKFREASAGSAFYNQPAPDGSRPGIYYVNLVNMKEQPIYQLEALAFHEAIPGHHMQLSLAQEQQSLPKFRRYSHFTAYTEGWGLYAERLAKEMGFYKDAYSDFGRLAMELRRAGRLVVDTGIHYKRWTREQAIDYLMQNTPEGREDNTRAIERYIVMPGQATAYMIGMLKILSLRKQSETQLGERFDIKAYHDLVLGSGSVPLTVLEQVVSQWIKEKNISRQ